MTVTIESPTTINPAGAGLATDKFIIGRGTDWMGMTTAAAAALVLSSQIAMTVRVATTANIALTGAQTIDTEDVVAGNRVLVKNQSAPAENGVYVAAAGAWSRATDMDTWAEVPGAMVTVQEGLVNVDTVWISVADPGGVLNTTAIAFTKMFGANVYQPAHFRLSWLAARDSPRVFGLNNQAVTHTGNLVDTTLRSFTLPAGSLGPNGQLRVWSLWTVTNNANVKTLRVKLGGVSFSNVQVTTNLSYQLLTLVRNRNSQNAQIGQPSTNFGGVGATTFGVLTAVVNTAVAQTVELSALLANAADSVTLEAFSAEVIYGA